MAIKISSVLQLQQGQDTFLKAWESVFPLIYDSYSPVLSGYCGKKKGKLYRSPIVNLKLLMQNPQ